MKTIIVLLIVTVVWAFFSRADAQHKHMQMMEMLKDSVMMDLMMDHIASDNQRRTLMMEKMIYYAVGDTIRMTEICRMMIDDKRMLPLLMTMLHEKTKSNKTTR